MRNVLIGLMLTLGAAVAAAQDAGPAAAPTPPEAGGGVEMNLPGGIPLRHFADLTAEELGWDLVYDESVFDERNVTLRFSGRLSHDGMRQLLEGALADAGLRLSSLDGGSRYRIGRLPDMGAPGLVTAATVQVLELEHAPATGLAETVRQVLVGKLAGEGLINSEMFLRVKADARSNTLIVVAPPETQALASKLIEKLDVPSNAAGREVESYKLKNSTAGTMIRTLRQVAGLPPGPAERGDSDFNGEFFSDAGDGGANVAQPSGGPSGQLPPNPFGGPDLGGTEIFNEYGEPIELAAVGAQNQRPVLVADRHTNSIIVVADAETQQTYAALIAMLDERRPQVQIEATLVSLNTTNDFSLGVEFGDSSNEFGGRLVTFSSFGVSAVETDPSLGVTGNLLPANALGFTAALLDNDFADVVLRAFEEDSMARVLSSPTILVNDNEIGQLGSIREEPVLETVQGEVVATTSFKEFVEAGTQIKVRPHISEDGYLQLEYQVEVSTFTGPANAEIGAPPPRQTEKVGSRVTIPDGDTIVVGGLTRRDDGEVVRKIPLLGDIPIVGNAFKRTDTSFTQTTLFVFLRPRILDDDDFADLRNLSGNKVREADLPRDLPHHARPAAVEGLPADAPVLIVD